MTERTRNVIVGLTAIVGLAAMGWIVFMFGEAPDWTREFYEVRVTIDNASGLSAGSRVKLRGIDIGQIDSVHFQGGDPAQGVVLRCRIVTDYRIPVGSVAVSQSSLLGSGAELSIIPPETAAAEPTAYLPTDEVSTLPGRSQDIRRQLASAIEDLTDQLEPQLERFGQMADEVSGLAARYAEVGEKINGMLEDRPLEAVEAGEAAPNLTTMIRRADARLAEMRSTTQQLNQLLGDEQLINDLKGTVANARQATASVTEFSNQATELTGETRAVIQRTGQRVDQLTRNYVALADDLSNTLGRINAVVEQARTGDGTIGLLLREPGLYQSLTDSAQRLSEAARQAQLLLEKWQEEGLPIQF